MTKELRETKIKKMFKGKNDLMWLNDTLLRRQSVVTDTGVMDCGIEASQGRDPEAGFEAFTANFHKFPLRMVL